MSLNIFFLFIRTILNAVYFLFFFVFLLVYNARANLKCNKDLKEKFPVYFGTNKCSTFHGASAQ